MTNEQLSCKVDVAPRTKHKRSRFGCRECKRLKMKCDEKKPSCSRCERRNKQCDYSIALTWQEKGGDKKKASANKRKSSVEDVRIPKEQYLNQLNNSVAHIDSASKPPATVAVPSYDKALKEAGSSFLDDLARPIRELSKSLDGETYTGEVPATSRDPSPADGLDSLLRDAKRGAEVDVEASREKKLRTNQSKIGTNHMANYLRESLRPGLASLTNALENIMGEKASFDNFGHTSFLQDLNFQSQFDLGLSGDQPLQENTSARGGDYAERNTPGPGSISALDLGTGTSPHSLLPLGAASAQPVVQPIDDLLLEFDTYQEDLMKIDAAFESESNNVLSFPHAMRAMKTSPPSKIVAHLSDDEEEIEEEEYHNALANYNKRVKRIAYDIDDEELASTPSSSNSNKLVVGRSLMPLPDLLLNVPYYLESFHFYRDVTSNMLVPAPAQAYTENPFKVILPRLAMMNESILSILVAFGITHKSFMLGQPEPKEILDQLLSRCLKDLILLLEDKDASKSDLTLALILIILSFDAFTSIRNNWKFHLQGAKQILIKRGLKTPLDRKLLERSPSSRSNSLQNIDELPATVSSNPLKSKGRKEANVTEFLVEWFIYVDTFSTLATPLKPSVTEIENDADGGNPNTDFGTKRAKSSTPQEGRCDYDYEENADIDMFAGFDTRFFPVCADLISLIRRTNSHLFKLEQQGQKPSLPQDIIIDAVAIREGFAQIFQSSSLKYFGLPEDDPLSILKYTNELFYSAFLVHLYRRVFMVPQDDAMLQLICYKMMKILRDKIAPGSNAEICSSFPIFTAAAETLDPEVREFFLARMTDQYHIGNYICKKLREVLLLCWTTNTDWLDVVEQHNIDLTFI